MKAFYSKCISIILFLAIILSFSSCMAEERAGGIWFSGEGAPSDTENSIVGDFYVDTVSYDVYSRSESGWTLLFNMKGNDGNNGADGNNGENGTDGNDGATWLSGKGAPTIKTDAKIGDLYFDTLASDVYQLSTTGWTKIANLKGETGSAGEDGKDGATWITGEGAPSNTAGNDGDLYLDTAATDIYKKDCGAWVFLLKLNAGSESGKQDWRDDGTLKILCIGNSFSVDTMEYAYGVAKDLGIQNIKLGNLYIGGCSIDTHYANATSGAKAYTYYTNTSGTWETTNDYAMATAIQCENWDYISFQQNSGNSGKPESFSNLQPLIDIVSSMCPKASVVWNMTWAYNDTYAATTSYGTQANMYSLIISALREKILTNDSIELLSPTGTAIQNARTSMLGNDLTRDGFHLSKTVGRYIAAVTFIYALTGFDISNLTYMPSGVTQSDKKIAIESALNAVEKPLEITNSKYTTADASKIVDLGLMGNCYYSSLSGTSVVTTHELCPMYACTRVFTREDLPVGTVIEIASEFYYRPEGWINGQKNTSGTRPGNVYTARVVIDETWWGEFTTRAFNIRMRDDGLYEDNKEAFESALTITLP